MKTRYDIYKVNHPIMPKDVVNVYDPQLILQFINYYWCKNECI